jgi:hypothetical protein
MKTQLLLAVLLGLSLGACSSSSKKEMKDAQEKVETKADQAADKAKETAKDAKAKIQNAVAEKKCTLGKDVRTISVKALDAGGCEVIYNKFGEDTSIASGSKGSEHCASVVSKVADNLQNAGFKCE